MREILDQLAVIPASEGMTAVFTTLVGWYDAKPYSFFMLK